MKLKTITIFKMIPLLASSSIIFAEAISPSDITSFQVTNFDGIAVSIDLKRYQEQKQTLKKPGGTLPQAFVTSPVVTPYNAQEQKQIKKPPNRTLHQVPVSSPLATSHNSIAKILASDNSYLQSLYSITGAPEFLNLLGRPNDLSAILPLLTIEDLNQFLNTIKDKKSKEADQLRNLISEHIRALSAHNAGAGKPVSPKPNQADQRVPEASRLLAGRAQFNIEGANFALFNVAPLGDCGLLSLPGNITRDEARRLVEGAMNTPGQLHPDDVAYLREQHRFLTIEGQSLQQRHLKLIGFLLGYDVSFYSDIGGMLIEDSDIKIMTKAKSKLEPAYIYDGEGHFQALIPVNDIAALQCASEKEKEIKPKTYEFAKRFQ